MKIKMFINALCITFLTIFSTGCANYKLGSTLDPALADVYVPTVRSKVNQPGIEAIVTSAILKEIQREGTLRISNKANASTILEIEIIDYDQTSLRYQSDDRGRTAEYTMTIKAVVSFRRHNSIIKDPIILQGVYFGEEIFQTQMDIISAKQRCLPEASKDLAEQIIDACISVW